MLSNVNKAAIITTKESFTAVFSNWLKSDEEDLTVTWLPSEKVHRTKTMEFTKVFGYIPAHPELVIILQYGGCQGTAFWNSFTGQFLCPAFYLLLDSSLPDIPDNFSIIEEVKEELGKRVVELFLAENKELFDKAMADIRGGRGLSHFQTMERCWLNLSDTYDEQKSWLCNFKGYGCFDTHVQFHHILAYWLGDTSVVHEAKEDYFNAVDKTNLNNAIRDFCTEKYCREDYKPSEMASRAKGWATAVKEFVQEGAKTGKTIVKLRVRICDSCGNVKIRYVPWERLTIPWDYYCDWNNDSYDEEITSISYGRKVIVGIGKESVLR